MKFRVTLALLIMLIGFHSVHAQTNCCNVVPGPVQSNPTLVQVPAQGNNPGGTYISTETDTYVIQCINSSTQKSCNTTPSTPNNVVTATGQGGFTGGTGPFVACSPLFPTPTNTPTDGTASSTFQSYGKSRTGPDSTGACTITSTQAPISQCPTPSQVATAACPTVASNCNYRCDPSCNPDADPTQCGGTPIILDTSGQGFILTSATNGVKFDIAGTGTSIQMGWTAPGADNAFLALPGTDGLIHNGTQLFGNHTPQPASAIPNGFAALAVYDDPKNGGNGDGIIDARDAVFSLLRLWIDTNHDGISQPEELHTLPSLGVNSISLTYKADQRTDQWGNVFHYRAQVNPGSATSAGRMAYDVFFVTTDTTTKNIIPLIPAGGKCQVPTKKIGMLATTGAGGNR